MSYFCISLHLRTIDARIFAKSITFILSIDPLQNSTAWKTNIALILDATWIIRACVIGVVSTTFFLAYHATHLLDI